MRKVGRWYLIAGGLMVGAILLVAIFADQLTSVSPYYYHTRQSFTQGFPPFPPGEGMPLGTDELGRDVWSRIAYGARWSLLFAFMIMGFRMLLALPMALIATFGPRWVNWVLGRLYVFTSAVPPLLVYVLILTSPGFRLVGLTKSVTITIALLTILEWPRIAVLLRGRMEEISLEPFMEGAIAVGATRGHLFWSHMLPHLWPTLLQSMTAEMGRALLNIAQLGFFGIWVGGGQLELIEAGDFKVSVSVPEWGTLLAGARDYVRTAPWIPIAPATAFFIGIAGFNLLSQGLDKAIISVSSLRFRLTAQLRWGLSAAVATAVIAGLLLYHKGLPWGHSQEIKAMAARQEQLLEEKQVEQYLETFLDLPGLRAGQRGWLESLPQEGLQSVMIIPSEGKVTGGEAKALWTMIVGYRDGPPIIVPRSVHLVRRGGTWYDAGEALSDFRGVHSTVRAYYDPTAPGLEVADARYRVNLLASVVDHGYRQAAAAVPWPVDPSQRITVNLYPSHEGYRNVVRGHGAKIDPDQSTLWLAPDQVLHVSYQFTMRPNRKLMQEVVAFEVLKFLVQDHNKGGQTLPILTGLLEISLQSPNPYQLLVSGLAGRRFYELEELFALTPDALGQAERPVYVAQCALLVKFLEAELSPERARDLLKQEDGDPLETVAQELGVSRKQLSHKYQQYLYDHLAGRSVLNLPGGKVRVPESLLTAIHALPSPAPGVTYEAALLDLEAGQEINQVTLLERYTLANGTTAIGITIQEWTRAGESWAPGKKLQTWTPAGGDRS